LDGNALGAEDTSAPYSVNWDTTTANTGSRTLTARARDAAGNQATSSPIAVTVSATPPPPPTGLVAAYGFSEGSGNTTADVSGNGNAGVLTNGTGWTSGKYGNAASFDGINDNVSIANSASLTLGSSGTIEAWVKLNAINRWNSVLAKGAVNNDSLHNYAMEVTNGNRFLCILGNGSSSRSLSSATAVAAAQFYHVACVWNGP